MRISTISDGAEKMTAVLRKESWLPLPSNQFPDSTKKLMHDWQRWRSEIERFVDSAGELPEPSQDAFAAPILDPPKVICIGKNYADHAREMGSEPPSIPVVFNKFATAIIGPNANVVLPEISTKVDFEAELVVVIGTPGRDIDRDEALHHVFGYCCGNDISARDWQKEKPGGQWLLGKTFDTFAPIGPHIVTSDEIDNPHDLEIVLRLNGQTMQQSSTRNLIFPIDFLIAHLSKFVTLQTGDLIFTGTPEGVGAGRTPPLFLKHGDNLEVEISKLGVLRNSVVAQ